MSSCIPCCFFFCGSEVISTGIGNGDTGERDVYKRQEQQIAILYCGTHGLLRDVPLNNVQDFERSFIESLQLNHQEDVLDVLRTGVIDDNVTKAIEETAAMVAKQYL